MERTYTTKEFQTRFDEVLDEALSQPITIVDEETGREFVLLSKAAYSSLTESLTRAEIDYLMERHKQTIDALADR